MLKRGNKLTIPENAHQGPTTIRSETEQWFPVSWLVGSISAHPRVNLSQRFSAIVSPP
jgi:hypothetical protein